MKNGVIARRLRGRKPTQRSPECRGFLLVLPLVVSSGFAEQPTAARIYRCEGQATITFSDRPCREAPSSEVVLPPINSYHEEIASSRPVNMTAKPTYKESKQPLPESIAAEQLKEKQRCQRLVDQLDTIRSKMRSGYTVQQGEKLRERQRQLEQQRRTERCK